MRILPVVLLCACASAPAPMPATAPGSAALAAIATAPSSIPAPIAAALAAPDRSEADRALDAGRKPAEMLAFFGIEPGMRVAEVGSGGGYTSELLARVVGPSGQVFGQNAPFVLKRFAEKPWSERLAKPVMARVVRLDRSFDDPFPPEVKDLDAVLMVAVYHDTVWQGANRDAMNRAVFAALRPGGVFGLIDSSAAAGAGITVTQTLHRIERSAVVAEVERAGFKLRDEASFLANPADARDWNASPGAATAAGKRGTSDRFVLLFEKPR